MAQLILRELMAQLVLRPLHSAVSVETASWRT